jgi:hypothetical protein
MAHSYTVTLAVKTDKDGEDIPYECRYEVKCNLSPVEEEKLLTLDKAGHQLRFYQYVLKLLKDNQTGAKNNG